jgi:hypothetical protein
MCMGTFQTLRKFTSVACFRWHSNNILPRPSGFNRYQNLKIAQAAAGPLSFSGSLNMGLLAPGTPS